MGVAGCLGGCLGPAGSACITGIKTARWGGWWWVVEGTKFSLSLSSRKENTQGVLYSDPGQRVLYAFFTRSFNAFFT